jgi:hypothetical protein
MKRFAFLLLQIENLKEIFVLCLRSSHLDQAISADATGLFKSVDSEQE